MMLGLRTKEDPKFEKYMELVQKAAKKQGCAFYLECEDGNDASFDDMDVSELTGWLVPEDKALEFEAVWLLWKEDDTWIDYYRSVVWSQDKKGRIHVKFEKMPDFTLEDFGFTSRQIVAGAHT